MDTKTIVDLQALITDKLLDITISNPEKNETLTKIKIRPMELKGQSAISGWGIYKDSGVS